MQLKYGEDGKLETIEIDDGRIFTHDRWRIAQEHRRRQAPTPPADNSDPGVVITEGGRLNGVRRGCLFVVAAAVFVFSLGGLFITLAAFGYLE